MPGSRVVAAALGERNLCLAQIAAVQLRLPDLSDDMVRSSLEAADRLIKSARGDDRLARGGWDPAEHARAGVPPNPGWFAPAEGQAPTEIAQGEEEERAPEELLDPMVPLRQARWDAGMATLRQIDPQNPNLSYFSNPGTVPSQEALDRLHATVEAAAIKRVTDRVIPGGVPIGTPGRGMDVRELPGGLGAARALFDYLRVGGEVVYKPNSEGTLIKLPGRAGYVTFRPASESGSPAVDINVPRVTFEKYISNEEVSVHDIESLVNGYIEESKSDFVGLWQISGAVRRRFGAHTTDEARHLSLQVVEQLYARGLRPGDYYLGTRFDYWPDEGCQAALDRIEREWIAAGHDPNLAEPICWFAPRPK